jgi:hypothetical protein
VILTFLSLQEFSSVADIDMSSVQEKMNEVEESLNNKKLTIWDKFKLKDEELASAKKAKLEKENLVDNELEILKKNCHEAADLILKSSSPKKDNSTVVTAVFNTNQITVFNNPLIGNVTLNQLVWAPCSYYGGDFFFARIIVNDNELLYISSVQQYIPLIWSLPKNQIVVEFFCLPETFKRYAVVDIKKLKKFDDKPKTLKKKLFKDSKNLSSTTGVVERTYYWTEQNCNEALQVVLFYNIYYYYYYHYYRNKLVFNNFN